MRVSAFRTSVSRPIPSPNGNQPRGKFSSLALVALVLSAICISASCGGGKGSGSTTITSVTISPTSITVPLNTTTTFTAVVNLSNSTTTSSNVTISWEVNGAAGGNIATLGSIVPLADNQLQATYTAPSTIPTTTVSGVTQVGQVVVTAVATQTNTSSSGSGTPPTVTSNNGIVTVGAGSGLTVSPPSPSVPAGATQQFTALLNGLTDTSAKWSVTPSGDASVYGSVDANGLYTAPLTPPPGGTVTVTATDPAANAPATATVSITYSDHSLTGPYAFSYTGNDSQGFLAVAGSLVTNGNGHITSGVEDMSSFLTGVKTVQINGSSSTYVIGPDGRGTASITTNLGQNTWDFVVTSPGHAQITRFDTNATGGGSMDQQSLDALSATPSLINGPYVFSLLGADASFNPLGLAGKFTADGAGNIPHSASIIDVNDNGIASGTVTTSDTTLQGSYQFDTVFTGTGRGTLTLTSNATGGSTKPRVYVFYAVDTPNSPNLITRLHLLEIDSNAFVAGDMFSAPAGPAALTAGNYAFTGGGDVMVPVSGGSPTLGAYASGGIFTSGGSGTITGGKFDANAGGTYNGGVAINSCSSYTTDATTGRIDLKIFTGNGACPTPPNASLNEYALYLTSQGTAVLLEIDANALSTATAYQQATSGALTAGSLAVGFVGQGVFHNNSALYQPNASGQITVGSTGSVTDGTLDINTFGTTAGDDPVTASGTSLGAPDSTGRGTGTIVVSSPSSTFKIIYYLIDDNTALFLDQDTTPIAIGIVLRQF